MYRNIQPPENLKCFCWISTQGIFFTWSFGIFFFSCYDLSFGINCFCFWQLSILALWKKRPPALRPELGTLGTGFKKIGRDAHNLQPFNGLILKIKQKQWLFPIWAQLCDWLYMYCNCLLTRLWHQNLIFLIKLFLHMTKKSKQKLIYLESKKSF